MKPHQKRSELNGDCKEAIKKRLRNERYNSEREGVSCKHWFMAAFQPVVLVILSKSMDL